MKVDGKHFCDWCCVEFEADKFTDRLRCKSGYAIHALSDTLLCSDCDGAIDRKKPAKIPISKKLRAYLRGVESGKTKAPWSSGVIRNANGNRMCVPVPLTLEGKPKKR
jgi:hypothetical protein